MTLTPATSTTSLPTNERRLTPFLFWVLLLVICLVSVILPGPPLLGEWESQTVYAVFGAQANQLALTIAPAANIGGQGYLLLDISRYLIETFNLPYTIDFVRLPTKLIGAVGLVAFGVVARRWFGPWPALAATALLAVNPLYHQYQNELIIAGPSLVVLIVLLERLQHLAHKPESWPRWLTLMIVWSLLLTMYGPARIYGTALITMWLAYCAVQVLRSKMVMTLAGFSARAATTGVFVPVSLILAAPSNVQFLNRTILFPRVAESTLINGSLGDSLGALPLNAKILAETAFLGGGEHHSTFVEATLIQGRFPTLPLVIVPLVLAGLALATWYAWLARRTPINKYLVIVGLAGMTTLPLLSSSVSVGEYGPTSTLVNHRFAFFLLPAYLSIASLVAFAASGGRKWRLTAALIAIAIFVSGAIQISIGHSSFLARAAATDPGLTGKPGQAQWLGGYALSGKGVGQGSHFQQHEQYRRWATIAAENLEEHSGDSVIILATSLSCFPEAPFVPRTLSELREKNYHSTFLSIYLGDSLHGGRVGYVNIPDSQEPVGWVMYESGVFSGPLQMGSDMRIDYSSPDRASARIMTFGSEPTRLLVTTTPTELNAASQLLTQQGRVYEVRQDLPCWAGT